MGNGWSYLNSIQVATISKKKKILVSTGWFWTGGTDVISESEWVWPMTGIPITLFADWREGEPNDEGIGEDCLQYGTHHTKKWNDNKCNATLSFICEKTAVY